MATELVPEEVPFTVFFEDAWIIVLYKPPGIVVHPGPGHSSGTLVHGLLKHCTDLSGIGGTLRPGIVHRLGQGYLRTHAVAKNDMAHQALAQQFQDGTVHKEYVALVHGLLSIRKRHHSPPHPSASCSPKRNVNRQERRSQCADPLKKITDCEEGFSLLSITIKTGRTHQILRFISPIWAIPW